MKLVAEEPAVIFSEVPVVHIYTSLPEFNVVSALDENVLEEILG